MSKKKLSAEERIMNAAREEFQRAGFGGARTQKIADEAGINKASLHYYYRNKETLFQQVLQKDFLRFMIPVGMLMREPSYSLNERIRMFVKTFSRLLSEHPGLPLFIMQELTRAPEQLTDLVKGVLEEHGLSKNDRNSFVGQIRDGVRKGEVMPVKPEQFIVSVMGMCLFPFAAKSLVIHLFDMQETDYQRFLEERQEEVIISCERMLYNRS